MALITFTMLHDHHHINSQSFHKGILYSLSHNSIFSFPPRNLQYTFCFYEFAYSYISYNGITQYSFWHSLIFSHGSKSFSGVTCFQPEKLYLLFILKYICHQKIISYFILQYFLLCLHLFFYTI